MPTRGRFWTSLSTLKIRLQILVEQSVLAEPDCSQLSYLECQMAWSNLTRRWYLWRIFRVKEFVWFSRIKRRRSQTLSLGRTDYILFVNPPMLELALVTDAASWGRLYVRFYYLIIGFTLQATVHSVFLFRSLVWVISRTSRLQLHGGGAKLAMYISLMWMMRKRPKIRVLKSPFAPIVSLRSRARQSFGASLPPTRKSDRVLRYDIPCRNEGED